MQTESKVKKQGLSDTQVTMLIILRVLIGWHFLYEGIAKLLNPNWTAIGYLLDSQGIFSGFYHSLASNPSSVEIVNFLNIWGLILIGSGLILGLFTKISSISGAVLLALYYLSHPPFAGLEYNLPVDGNYLWVDKTLIELFTLILLYFFPTGKIIGLDRIIFRKN